MTKFHSPDCENAHSSRCRCWCGGEFHGIHSGVFAKLNGKPIKPVTLHEKLMSPTDGGDVEKQILELTGKQFSCVGCNRPLTTTPLWGYPHEGGFADGNDLYWWLYVKCPSCTYATSLWKIKNHIIQEAAV